MFPLIQFQGERVDPAIVGHPQTLLAEGPTKVPLKAKGRTSTAGTESLTDAADNFYRFDNLPFLSAQH